MRIFFYCQNHYDHRNTNTPVYIPQIIQRIRHETDLIIALDPPLRQAAVAAYESALRAVFICQAGVALLTLLACLPIEENPLP